MKNLEIIDKDGVYISNPHQYPFYHSGLAHKFESGFTYKIKVDAWIQTQIDHDVLTEVADPSGTDEEQQAETEAIAAAKAARREKLGQAAVAAQSVADKKVAAAKVAIAEAQKAQAEAGAKSTVAGAGASATGAVVKT